MKIQDTDYKLTSEQAARLMQRYFDAETSEIEEAALYYFVSTGATDDNRFDELRAVMGLAAYGRSRPQRRGNILFAPIFVVRWAAVVAIVCTIAATGYNYYQKNTCVAYVGGERITDTEYVIKSMQHAFACMDEPTGEPSVEEQMNDMFRTLESTYSNK